MDFRVELLKDVGDGVCEIMCCLEGLPDEDTLRKLVILCGFATDTVQAGFLSDILLLEGYGYSYPQSDTQEPDVFLKWVISSPHFGTGDYRSRDGLVCSSKKSYVLEVISDGKYKAHLSLPSGSDFDINPYGEEL